MKICLINNLYPFVRGGAERIVEIQKEELEKAGYNVFIITTKPRFSKDFVNSTISLKYLKSCYLYLEKIPIFFRFFWHILDMFDLFSYYQLKKILRQEKPDVVISHNLTGIGFLSPFAIKICGIKHIHILHDIQLLHPSGLMFFGLEKKIDSFFSKLYQLINIYLFSKTDVILSPSKWLLDEHIKRNFFVKQQKIIFQNPAIIDKNDFIKTSFGIFNFLFIGQIEEHKGLMLLINAFKRMDQKKIRLNIVGEGSKKIEIEHQCECLNVNFYGKVDNKKVISLIQESDCLVVPSLCYENSPTVIYEAFANNLPVIGSDLGGISELLSNGRGILFSPNNVEDLYDKMCEIINNKTKLNSMVLSASDYIEAIKIDNYMENLKIIIEN